MSFKKKLLAVSVPTALAVGIPLALASDTGANQGSTQDTVEYDAPVGFKLSFVLHVDEDLAEQDVFVEREPGSGRVYRPTKAERDMSLPLYASAEPIEHAPFEAEGLGPWPKGEALGITLGEWLASKGTGHYSCRDGQGHLEAHFTNLVPNGTYTLWHYFLAWPPTNPFIGTYDLPIGARDGSESVFQADAQGQADIERSFKPCLQLTGEHLAAGLAIAWHSDGKTYGPLPGEFTTTSHVHMYTGLPKRSGI